MKIPAGTIKIMRDPSCCGCSCLKSEKPIGEKRKQEDDPHQTVLLTTFVIRRKRCRVYFHRNTLIWETEKPPYSKFFVRYISHHPLYNFRFNDLKFRHVLCSLCCEKKIRKAPSCMTNKGLGIILIHGFFELWGKLSDYFSLGKSYSLTLGETRIGFNRLSRVRKKGRLYRGLAGFIFTLWVCRFGKQSSVLQQSTSLISH